MLAEPYTPETDPLAVLSHPVRAAISVYAQGKDYHDLVKRRLKRLGRWLLDQGPKDAAIKVFVDTAPVMEKPLGEAAGIGWQGKHTNLVSPTHGSWLFLGAIYTTLDLAPARERGIPVTNTPDSISGAVASSSGRAPGSFMRPLRRSSSTIMIPSQKLPKLIHRRPPSAIRSMLSSCSVRE